MPTIENCCEGATKNIAALIGYSTPDKRRFAICVSHATPVVEIFSPPGHNFVPAVRTV
jgi:hypothetical protein